MSIIVGKEMYDQIDISDEFTSAGESKYPGMSYEDGVKTALEWTLGDIDEPPMN